MIEKSTKHLAIYSPDGWRQAVSMAKRTKPVYDVLEGLAQAKIIKKSVILFWIPNMTI